MERNITINNLNIYTTWGAELDDGSLESLLTPPPVKDYIENESRLESGTRITDVPKLRQWANREVTLRITIKGNGQADYLAKYVSFVEMLTSGKLAVGVPVLGMEFSLYYLSCSKYGSYGLCKGKFVLKLREPNPKERKKIE